MRIIDLTYTVADTMVVWPGNQRPIFEWKSRVNSDNCNATIMSVNCHTGTHVDSPLHFVPGAQTVDKVPLERFFGKARLFRFREPPNGQKVTLKMVKDSRFAMDDAEIFVLDTGISVFAETRDYNFKFPVPDFDLLEWLIASGVKSFMTDATAIDFPTEADASPRHVLWFKSGYPVVENLKNLDQLPENKTFIVSAMPLKLDGREGSPCRAAAWLED